MCADVSGLFSQLPGNVLATLEHAILSSPVDYDLHPVEERVGQHLIEDLKPRGYQLKTFDWQRY